MILIIVLVVWPASAGERGKLWLADPAHMQIQVSEGLLTLDARGAPLAAVLHTIGGEAGFDVVIEGNLGVGIDQSFTELPLNEGLVRLLDGVSFMMFSSELNGLKSLDQLRVYATADTGARLFESDSDPFVRGQIAATLGEIDGEVDSGLLEVALTDEDVSVRRDAIQALRAVGAERAIPVLGHVLYTDPSREIRLMALRMLVAASSDTSMVRNESRYHLELATADPDETIRQVANHILQVNRNHLAAANTAHYGH